MTHHQRLGVWDFALDFLDVFDLPLWLGVVALIAVLVWAVVRERKREVLQ
jgi:hypothetical protein